MRFSISPMTRTANHKGLDALNATDKYLTQTTQPRAKIRIMATTDLHTHLMAYDYFADKPSDTVGLTRTASLIRQARSETANAFLFDNGDFLQGGPLGDYIARKRRLPDGRPHPVIAAMNRLGYDAATLGNHEFNFGLGFLMASLADARFPIVSANVATHIGTVPERDKTLVPPYVLLDRTITDIDGHSHALRFGVIGFLPPQILQWDRFNLTGRVQTRDIVQTVRAYVPQIQANGADLIIALCHSGIGYTQKEQRSEHAALAVAAVEGVDVVLCGHTHMVFPGPYHQSAAGIDAKRGTLHSKPAVMAGANGSHLGIVDLSLTHRKGRWQIAAQSVQTRPIARHEADGKITALVGDDPDVAADIAADHRATLAFVRQPVGRTTTPIHSYFAQASNELSVQIVTTAQRWFAQKYLIHPDNADLPLLSAASPFRTGGHAGPDNYTHMPSGDLAIRNIADIYPFPNKLRCLRITGAGLRNWLEHCASAFYQLSPGTVDQPLLDPHFPSYNFDVIDGVTYQIDLSQPARTDALGAIKNPGAWRINHLHFQNRPIGADQEFIIITNSFRAASGRYVQHLPEMPTAATTRSTVREVIIHYIRDQGTISPKVQQIWRFAPMPGTSAVFDSAPDAISHLDSVRFADITHIGQGTPGFARFRLKL